ncbi:MAG: hypothetical protein AMK75_00380 [Planctomycetes bacterium SM23_65]|nr:MAG: hypothetical protein AMK75_00380 [Planctomycetes bacterium SM23_65]
MVVVVLPSAGACADSTVFDFSSPEQFHEWHGDVRVERADRPGMVLRFEKTGQPVWTCWAFPEDWEKFAKLVIELDADKNGTELGLALSDEGEYLVGISLPLRKGRNEVSVPVRKLFEAGLQIGHMRGIALWARKNPAAVAVRRVRLAGSGVDLSNVPRFGTRVLNDAEGRSAEFMFYYSHQAGRVRAVPEHAAGGERSLMIILTEKGKVSSWGRFPHDWRGYESYAFEAYNPEEVPVKFEAALWDSHVPFVSNRYIARLPVTLPPKQTTTVTWDLAGLEGESVRAPRGRLKMKYVQSLRFERGEGADTIRLYVDNLRLVGKPGRAFERMIAPEEIPKFGFEHARDKLKLPVGPFDRLTAPSNVDGLKRIRIPDAPARPSRLRVGAARVKVTPRVGTRMATDRSKSVAILDDLYVRVLVLEEQGRDPIVWLHRDHVFSGGQPTVSRILAERLKIKPENTFWSATHTHSSGWWGDKAYREGMMSGLIEAAEKAHATMKPVRVAIAKTRAKFNYNRVIKGPDGKFPGNLYEMYYLNYLMDSRPTDEGLAMIWFVGPDEKPVAGIVCYTAHGNMLCRVAPVISGDWSGWTQQLLEVASGAVVMHVNGAEGDVDMRGNGVSVCRTIRAGWDVARAAMGATEKKVIGIDPGAFAGVSVRHGAGVGTPSESDRGKGITERVLKVDVLTLGPIAFVDVRGELWNRFGREIKANSPFPHTYINMSSGGYFCEEFAFEQKLYGTWNRQPDWGGVVRDASVKRLNEAAGRRP